MQVGRRFVSLSLNTPFLGELNTGVCLRVYSLRFAFLVNDIHRKYAKVLQVKTIQRMQSKSEQRDTVYC